jgi:hypothetical protein
MTDASNFASLAMTIALPQRHYEEQVRRHGIFNRHTRSTRDDATYSTVIARSTRDDAAYSTVIARSPRDDAAYSTVIARSPRDDEAI